MFAIRRKIAKLLQETRNVHNNSALLDNLREVVNKNPRNLELLKIARKPHGYNLDDKKQIFWHKLEILKFPRYVTAQVIHNEQGVVLTACTKEAGIRKQLFSMTDASAYKNIGMIIARRCLESGIYQVRCDLQTENSEKLKLFCNSAKSYGLQLREHKNYYHALPQSKLRHEKPWEVYD